MTVTPSPLVEEGVFAEGLRINCDEPLRIVENVMAGGHFLYYCASASLPGFTQAIYPDKIISGGD